MLRESPQPNVIRVGLRLIGADGINRIINHRNTVPSDPDAVSITWRDGRSETFRGDDADDLRAYVATLPAWDDLPADPDPRA